MDSNKRPNVICLVIDRLSIGYLGAYGNTWINTPALDQLAAESLVLDRAIIDSPHLDVIYRSLWLGLHALCPIDFESKRNHLATCFSQAGWHAALLSDQQEVINHRLAAAFEERVSILSQKENPNAADTGSSVSHFDNHKILEFGNQQVAQDILETDAATVFASLTSWLESVQQPFLLWFHTGTLGRVWDAPLEFRQQFADEDDPSAGSSAKVPNRVLSEHFNPDELLPVTHAYAGQVSMLDQLLGSLLDAIKTAGLAENTLLVCLSPRGFPLGEHLRLGPYDEALYAELTHVPCMIRFPASMGIRGRCQHLVQPADISDAILASCGLSRNSHAITRDPLPNDFLSKFSFDGSIPQTTKNEIERLFDRACVLSPPNQQVFVTSNWSLRLMDCDETELEKTAEHNAAAQSARKAELFVKPDDWFEVNEVSDRCPEIVEKMQFALDQFKQAVQTVPQAKLADLPVELTTEFK